MSSIDITERLYVDGPGVTGGYTLHIRRLPHRPDFSTFAAVLSRAEADALILALGGRLKGEAARPPEASEGACICLWDPTTQSSPVIVNPKCPWHSEPAASPSSPPAAEIAELAERAGAHMTGPLPTRRTALTPQDIAALIADDE